MRTTRITCIVLIILCIAMGLYTKSIREQHIELIDHYMDCQEDQSALFDKAQHMSEWAETLEIEIDELNAIIEESKLN